MKKNSKSCRRWLEFKCAKLILVMKLSFLLCVIFTVQVSAGGLAQKMVNMKVQNKSLRKVFKEIKKQTGYFVIFSEEGLQRKHRVSVNFENTDLELAMQKILDP